jgi:hypothetical protein
MAMKQELCSRKNEREGCACTSFANDIDINAMPIENALDDCQAKTLLVEGIKDVCLVIFVERLSMVTNNDLDSLFMTPQCNLDLIARLREQDRACEKVVNRPL